MQKTLQNGMPYATDKVGFGIYHFGQGQYDARGFRNSEYFAHDGYDREMCDYQENLDYMNFYIYRLDRSCHDHLRRIRDMGCVTWVFYSPFVRVSIKGGDSFCLKSGWREEIDGLVEGVKKAGLWDVVVGFQYDEPLLRLNCDDFEEFSEYMSKFGKRQMSLFSLYEIYEGRHPRADDPEFGMLKHVITPKSCRFLTDVGFDWYKPADYEKFSEVLDKLISMMGRDNFYVWHVPTTWTYCCNPTFTEDVCIENLNMCYKLLLDRKNPGGLFCYNWTSWGRFGSTQPDKQLSSLDHHFAFNNPNRWNKLEARMIEIGRELREIKLADIDLYSHLK